MGSRNALDVGCRMRALLLLAVLLPAPAMAQQDLVFIHHSVGSNWLAAGLDSALVAKPYIDLRNDMTYGTAVTNDTGRPASLGSVPGDSTDMHHWILWFNDYLAHVKQHHSTTANRIVMFKSCFPNSAIDSDGAEPGDPFSGSQTLANYRAVYRHPSGVGHTYTSGSVTYKPLEDVFAENPDTLFIPVTAPPLTWSGTDDASARRARQFNNWLKNVWLADYNSRHPTLHNVAVFDFFDVLATPDSDASHPDRLRSEYGGSGDDAHPNTAGSTAAIQVFATNSGNFIDSAFASFSGSVHTTRGDATGDGRADIVWRHASRGEVWLWPMNGSAPSGPRCVGAVADTRWRIAGLGDLNGDGKADILWRHQTTGGVSLWTMNGASVSAEQYVGAASTDFDVAGVADYTGDGKADILWRHQTTGELYLWQMNGASIVANTRIGTAPIAYTVVGSADANGDGKADILWQHQSNGEVWLWLMNGPTPLSQTCLGVVAGGFRISGFADFGGDGKADVLWRHDTTGDVWVWTMNGSSIAGMTHTATVGDTGFRVAGVGDYDGDGKSDVLWHHAVTGAVWVWRMNGGAIASLAQVSTVADVGYQIAYSR